MQRVVPALRVSSYVSSVEFYEKLGFREQWRHQHEPGLPVFASLVRAGMEINLTEHVEDCQAGGLVHFYVPDVDALHQEFLAAGVTIDKPPRNNLSPDIKDMLVIDLDGNRLSFLTFRGPGEPAADRQEH